MRSDFLGLYCVVSLLCPFHLNLNTSEFVLVRKVSDHRVKVTLGEGYCDRQHFCEVGLAAIGHSQFDVRIALAEEWIVVNAWLIMFGKELSNNLSLSGSGVNIKRGIPGNNWVVGRDNQQRKEGHYYSYEFHDIKYYKIPQNRDNL